MTKLYSLIAEPPPGFCHATPSKRHLLSGHIAILANDLSEAYALLPDFAARVRGLVFSQGDGFRHKQIGPYLWHVTIPDTQLPHLAQFTMMLQDILLATAAENDKNKAQLAEMAYTANTLAKTKDGFNMAMERVQAMMIEARHENERRQQAIAQLNHEIKERRKAQVAQLQLRNQLHNSQKMEAIGLMAGGVAHDLNNILAGLVGYPDILLQSLPAESDLRQPLERIKESGKRASEVVADLLAIARNSARDKEVIDPNQLIEQYQASLDFSRLKELHPLIDFQLELSADLSSIICSPNQLKKSLMNLAINGCEAIAGSGTLTLASHNQEITGANSADCPELAPGGYAVITVSDSGPGIAAKDLEHIFEPFYSRKKMGRSGTGLGLTVVWNSVQDNGGTIKVESSPQGTKFRLFFPKSRTSQTPQPRAIATKTLQGQGETILVVDDEELLLEIARGMLEELNYRVKTVNSGEKGVALVREEEIDLVVLDMVMGDGLSGCQTYAEMLKTRPGQRAIIASGFAENRETNRVMELGAAVFLRKPYTLNGLGQAVKDGLLSAGKEDQTRCSMM
ncbi:MAG: response regulator [Thermodesulfobacteriota bacterium]